MSSEKEVSGSQVLSKKSKCEDCEGKCCRYVAIEIDFPEEEQDLQHVRWYLAHGIWVYIEKDEDGDVSWNIQVNNPCSYLDSSNKCTIYEKRPAICRQHSEEECEFDEDPDVRMFRSLEQFDEWLDSTPREEVFNKE